MGKKTYSDQKFLYYLIVLLSVLASILFRYYVIHKKENYALKVKLISLNKIKKNPKPWTRLSETAVLANDKSVVLEKNKKINSIVEIKPLSSDDVKYKNVDETSIEDQSIDQLQLKLTDNMHKIKSLDLKSIFKNINLADEIINRVPESYLAYKAKLISMIYLESKFDQEIDDYVFNNILYDLASFDVSNDETAKKEAVFIMSFNSQILFLENQVSEIVQSRELLENQSLDVEKNSAEYQLFQEKDAELATKEHLALLALEKIENDRQDEASYLFHNEDILEIAFMRLMAINDFNAVVENAQDYLKQFPTSLNGYFYLLRALELSGDAERISQVLLNSKLSIEDQEKLRKRLSLSLSEDPKKYWEKLIF